MRLDRQLRAERDLLTALETFHTHCTGPSADVEHEAGMSLAARAHALLTELSLQRAEGEGYRVRCTSYGAGAPIADRLMPSIPRLGDLLNEASGELRVDEVHWNFDPAIPADVVLMLISPDEEDFELLPVYRAIREVHLLEPEQQA